MHAKYGYKKGQVVPKKYQFGLIHYQNSNTQFEHNFVSVEEIHN